MRWPWYYPDAQGTTVVDFLVALAEDPYVEIEKCTPATRLDEINWIFDDAEAADWLPTPRPSH